MLINRDIEIIQDDWILFSEDTPLKPGQHVVLDVENLATFAETTVKETGSLGIRVQPDDPISSFERWLDYAGLICLNFPGFSDGRAYSTARLLRSRSGYEGEIRAVGHVLPDQISFMAKCGIDSFQMHRPFEISVLQKVMSEITHSYRADELVSLSILNKRHDRATT